MPHQETWSDGAAVVIRRASGALERHEFENEAEARARAAMTSGAIDWVGTPFKNCSDIKGSSGGVDCAMLMVRSYVDSRRLPAFDPRPYPPEWHLHQDEERFLAWIRDRLGGVEVEQPRIGDCLVYRFGRCFSHGAILINSDEVVHAYIRSGIVQISRRDEQELAWLATGGPRPCKAFEVRP